MDTSFCRICHTMPNQYKLSSSCFSTSASNYWLPRYFCGKESRPEGQKEGTTFEDVILLTRVLNMMHNTNWYKNYNLMRPNCPCLQRLASGKLWRQCISCPLFTAEAAHQQPESPQGAVKTSATATHHNATTTGFQRSYTLHVLDFPHHCCRATNMESPLKDINNRNIPTVCSFPAVLLPQNCVVKN